ncbi:unnamed protein product [Brachionus calyciflorus]|uniref:MULE transposase domain-containing protein n=1 Tax=Brachionus calyciflorus TaxID=104777 RepID=A0A814HX78_9BILA|nr:unnamed protein product [Brachionus calyciflorus]
MLILKNRMPYSIYRELLLNNNGDPFLPKLTQIQSYIKYRRTKNGDINSIEGLDDFIRDKLYSNINLQDLDDDEPFYFGEEINNGSDENHFHLGITSKTLLKNMFHGLTFLFDCTYKIVKYGFPLIVFCCSDLEHKFYPILFFITSHEQENDFNFFWNSLLDVCKLLNNDLINSIRFICSDADRAIANSIKKNLENSTLIMCWFHLTANLSFFYLDKLKIN